MEKTKIIREKKKIDIVKEYRFYKAFSCSLVIFLFICYILYNTIGYMPIVSRHKAEIILNDYEYYYMYKDVFDKDYFEKKDKLIKNFFVSKEDIYKLIRDTFNKADDKFTYFVYDDFLFRNMYSEVQETKVEITSKIEDKYGYFKFSSFDKNISNDFKNFVSEIKQKNINNLVIDLRNNGGGLADEFTLIADILLPEGEIYSKHGAGYKTIFSSDNNFYEFDKIFIFLNEKSASCSEILALSLKENLKDKVVLIGNNTYNKPVGQNVIDYNKYHIMFYIVEFEWFVNNKTTTELNDYLKEYRGIKLENDADYFKIVEDNL